MIALYVMATTQLVALLIALDVAWREYHPAQVRRVIREVPENLHLGDTLVHDTVVQPVVQTCFHVVFESGYPRTVWA